MGDPAPSAAHRVRDVSPLREISVCEPAIVLRVICEGNFVSQWPYYPREFFIAVVFIMSYEGGIVVTSPDTAVGEFLYRRRQPSALNVWTVSLPFRSVTVVADGV